MSDLPPATKDVPGCISNAQSGYKEKKCVVYINRLAPVSPPTLVVPKDTTVYVVLYNTHWNEAVTFTSAAAKTTTPDVAAAALKNAATPLQSLVTTVVKTPKPGAAFALEYVPSDISKQQSDLADRLNILQSRINHANAAMNCLSNYEQLTEKVVDVTSHLPTKYSCSQENLVNPTSFFALKQGVIDEANGIAREPLPTIEDKRMDDAVTAFIGTCVKNDQPFTTPCKKDGDAYLSNQALLDSALTAVQSAQGTLTQSVRILDAWPGTPDNVAYQVVSAKWTNVVLTITGQEIVNKVASSIATVTINTQANPWVISAGLGFSNLTYHTFTAAPVID